MAVLHNVAEAVVVLDFDVRGHNPSSDCFPVVAILGQNQVT